MFAEMMVRFMLKQDAFVADNIMLNKIIAVNMSFVICAVYKHGPYRQ